MELAANSSLRDKIKNDLATINEVTKRMIIAEALLAIQGIHRAYICHRDLKPENILLDSLNHLKLADFGEAKRYDTNSFDELVAYFSKFNLKDID